MKKVATIGFFDGVHRGHQYLCQQLKQLAGEDGVTMVLTFKEHPKRVLGAPNAPLLLTSNGEKTYFLECSCGVDEVVLLDFDRQMAALSARDFMQQYLRDTYHITHLLIGYDHHFGRPLRDPAGQLIPEGIEDYQRYGQELGIEVILAKEFPTEQGVSSSAIRRLIAEGEIEEANRLLGYNFRVNGTIVSGHQVGRTIGFPTLNLRPLPDYLLPANGVYVTTVRVCGRDYPAVTNIGHRPTLDNGTELSVESHFLGVEKLPPFFDATMNIDIHIRLREEHRFPDLEALKAQIAQDVAEATEWHRSHPMMW